MSTRTRARKAPRTAKRSQHPQTLPPPSSSSSSSSSSSPSVPEDGSPGDLYFWANIQAKFVYDRRFDPSISEPITVLAWETADQSLRDEYRVLEEAFLREPFIQRMLAPKSNTSDLGTSTLKHSDQDIIIQKCQEDSENWMEVAACCVYENFEWMRYKLSKETNGSKGKLAEAREEARVKAEARERWAEMPLTSLTKAGCFQLAKREVMLYDTFLDYTELDLGPEIDRMDFYRVLNDPSSFPHDSLEELGF